MTTPTIGATHGIAPERVTLTEAQKREAQADLARELYGERRFGINGTDTPDESDREPANAR